MALCRLTYIFLLNCLFLININCDNDFHENLDEFYRPQIWSLVNYLNTNPNRVYNYNYATLISAQNKDVDSTALTIDADVDCRNPGSYKCITSLLECKGTIKYNTETANYEVLSVFCNPKTRIDLSRDEEFPETTEHTESPVEESVFLETNARQPVSEIPFTKSVAPCVGCPFDLNPNLESLNSLTDTALSHIESERNNKHVIVRILRAQRQVVAGIKYILLLEIAPTDCPKSSQQPSSPSCRLLDEETQICEVTYYQRPWISRNKNIISNNCTSSQEFNADATSISGNDQDNEIDKNYYPGKPVHPEKIDNDDKTNYDSIAEGNTDDILKITEGIMDSARMKDLESQIIFQVTEEPDVETTTEEVSVLTNDQKEAFDDFLGAMGDAPRFRRSSNNDNDSSSSSSSSSEEDNDNDVNDEEKTKRKTKKYRKHDKNDDDDNNDDNDNNNTNSSSSSSSSSSEEDNNDKEKKHKSKKNKRQVPESSEESSEENNNEDNRAKRQAVSSESNESSAEIQSPTPENVTPVENVAAIVNNKVSSEESSEENRGGVRRKRSLSQSDQLIKISPEEKNFVENLADFSASTLDDIDADNHKRIILQILGAKKNLDSSLYHLTLRVGVSKCPEEEDVTVDLQRPNQKDSNCRNKLFENLTKICKVQIRVDEDKSNPKVEKSHCQNIKKDQDDTTINRTFRNKRGGERLAGGINNVSPDDPKIVEYSMNVLKELDANEGVSGKRQLVKIVSASRQIVSGTLYRIKMKLTEHGTEIICDFDIWDQPWIKPNGKKVTVKCAGKEEKQYRYKRSHLQEEMLGKDDHDIHVGIFKSYMNKFNKKYSSKSEFKKRFKIFRENMKMIKHFNDNEQGTAKYGPTIFADLTKDEYKRYLGLKPSLSDSNNIPMPQAKIPDIELPKEFDWRNKNVISEVKNQGQCGSCWAFSVTGNIEGLNAIKTGKMIELSEQELVDCDTLDEGCNGGLPDNAYRAIEKLGGLETETDYPYEAENEKCHFNQSLSRVQISGAVNISSNETEMAKWLVQNGPISIGINANAMQFYMGGVSHPWKFLCSPGNLDHGVLIVGYGVHKYPLFNKVLPYWIVKNSWGPSWGEQGYYRVYRGDGTCGVNQMASSAVL